MEFLINSLVGVLVSSSRELVVTEVGTRASKIIMVFYLLFVGKRIT